MATKSDNKPQLTREQFTDEQWNAAARLFQFLHQLQREGKIGRKAA